MGPSFIHRVVHRLSTGRSLSQIPVMQRSTWCGPIELFGVLHRNDLPKLGNE